MGPVPTPLMMILCPRPVEFNIIEENMSAGQQIDEPENVALAADNDGDRLQGAAAPKRIRCRPILSSSGR